MEYIKIDFKTFDKLKEYVWKGDIKKITELLEEIEFDNLRKNILRLTYRNYKRTGNKEFLEEYIKIKNNDI